MVINITHIVADSQDEQFGMLYDKYTLSNLIHKFIKKYKINTVCECPTNNLLNNNSEAFEKYGCYVKKIKKFKKINKKFDLIWNFCEYERSMNSFFFVNNMNNMSRKYCFIVTQNKYNVLIYHRLYHLIKRKNWDHGLIKNMSFRSIIKTLNKFDNVNILEIGAFDVPWFIIDFYEGGTFFREFIPNSLLNINDVKDSIFENLPLPIKLLLAHHHYVMWCVK